MVNPGLIREGRRRALGSERAAKSKPGKPLTIGDGAFVGADVDFILQIEGQVFGKLFFHDGFVLVENLMVEIQRILQRRILVKVPADRDEDAGFPRGHGRSRVQDVQTAVFRKKHGEFRRERQPGFKETPPFETGRIEMLKMSRIIAHGAEVIRAAVSSTG